MGLHVGRLSQHSAHGHAWFVRALVLTLSLILATGTSGSAQQPATPESQAYLGASGTFSGDASELAIQIDTC
jgi:hypothetical protein